MICEILWMSKGILKQSKVKRISIVWQHFRSLCSDHQWKASLSALWLLRPLEEFYVWFCASHFGNSTKILQCMENCKEQNL